MNRVPDISVVICTHNRASYLVTAFGGLARQTLSPEHFEVIVVDNCSTDCTAETVAAMKGKKICLRYCFEGTLGLSQARNRGWREARGTYVAYLDDDAVPGPDWLKNALEEIEASSGDLGMLGGRVLPLWEAERPDWLSDRLLPYLTLIDLGDEKLVVDSSTGIVGANMIIRRDALAEVGGFSTALGRKGTSLLSNEELALKRALGTAGYRAVYRPDVMVSHHVPADRLAKRWFLRRLYWQGRSDTIWWQLTESPPLSSRLRFALRAVRRSLRHFRSWLSARNSSSEGFASLTECLYHLGQARSGLPCAGHGNGRISPHV